MPTLQESGPAHRGDFVTAQSDNKSPSAVERKKNSYFTTTEAGMCMKTNKTAIICRPKMTTFLRDLAECSDFSYRPSRILRESRPFLSRIERRRTQSCFQSAESQAPGFTGRANVADAYSSPPPGASAPPLLSQGGELLLRIGRGVIGASRGGSFSLRKMPMEATIFMKTQGLRGNSVNWAKIVSS